MDTPATLRKCPAFSPLNAEARQPTASVGSISPPCAWPPPPPKFPCSMGLAQAFTPVINTVLCASTFEALFVCSKKHNGGRGKFTGIYLPCPFMYLLYYFLHIHTNITQILLVDDIIMYCNTTKPVASVIPRLLPCRKGGAWV